MKIKNFLRLKLGSFPSLMYPIVGRASFTKLMENLHQMSFINTPTHQT